MTNQPSQTRSPAQQLIGIEAAAEMLGVPVRHVRRLVAERRVPFIKWGSRLHFDPVELEQWIDRHRIIERSAAEGGVT
jgi:excisionase family DNA binding protein